MTLVYGPLFALFVGCARPLLGPTGLSLLVMFGGRGLAGSGDPGMPEDILEEVWEKIEEARQLDPLRQLDLS